MPPAACREPVIFPESLEVSQGGPADRRSGSAASPQVTAFVVWSKIEHRLGAHASKSMYKYIQVVGTVSGKDSLAWTGRTQVRDPEA